MPAHSTRALESDGKAPTPLTVTPNPLTPTSVAASRDLSPPTRSSSTPPRKCRVRWTCSRSATRSTLPSEDSPRAGSASARLSDGLIGTATNRRHLAATEATGSGKPAELKRGHELEDELERGQRRDMSLIQRRGGVLDHEGPAPETAQGVQKKEK